MTPAGNGRKGKKKKKDEMKRTARPQLDQNVTERPPFFFDGTATVSEGFSGCCWQAVIAAPQLLLLILSIRRTPMEKKVLYLENSRIL
jgi:hypothetical protein